MYDNVNSATNSTTQIVTVSVTKLDINTTITKYTSFTTGATIPTNYTEQGKITTVSGSHYSGNAASATKLQTARSINGTNFNGSGNITTANWGTARNLQIGNSSKSVNGSTNVGWTLAEIGALPLSGGTMTGAITTPNNAQGIKVGDDAVICDRNVADHIVIEGTTSTNGGITFGSGKDTNIYRGGANILKTDDTFNAVNGFQWNGESLDTRYAKASHGTHVTYSTTTPKANGTAAVGSETKAARGDHVHPLQTSVSGNAGTATKLATARTIQIGNKSNTFDGSANISYTLADIGAATSGHTHNYAGSSSAGGAANSATKLATKRTINGTNFDGSANITTANWGTSRKINQISVNGSADVKLPLDYYTCNVGSSNAKPYHHILATGQCTGSYTDKSITIVLVNHYNSAGFGIAKATLRTNDVANGGTATGELRWIVRSGFAENSLCFNIRNTAKDAYMDVFYKSSGTYDSLTWYVLSEGRRDNHSSEWTKYNTHHDNGTNVYNETGMKAIRTYTATLQSAVDHGAVNSAKTAAACSGNAGTATKLQTAKTLTIGNKGKTFDGSGNVGWTLAEIGAAAAGHTHNQINRRGNVTCESGAAGRPAVSGLSMSQAYNNGYPTAYGNVISLKGTGDGQILVGWSGSDGTHAPVYVRSKRDNTTTANWSQWAQFYTTAHKPTPADIGAAPGTHSHNENTLTRTLVTKTASSNTLTLGTERYQLASGLSNGGTINLPTSPALLTEINLIINNVSLTTLNLPDTCKWRVDHNLEVGKYFMITFLYVATNVWLAEIKVYS